MQTYIITLKCRLAERSRCRVRVCFFGANCDFSGSSCDSNPCHHGGTCINNGDGTEFPCLCPAGTTGRTCQQDNTNESKGPRARAKLSQPFCRVPTLRSGQDIEANESGHCLRISLSAFKIHLFPKQGLKLAGLRKPVWGSYIFSE